MLRWLLSWFVYAMVLGFPLWVRAEEAGHEALRDEARPSASPSKPELDAETTSALVDALEYLNSVNQKEPARPSGETPRGTAYRSMPTFDKTNE